MKFKKFTRVKNLLISIKSKIFHTIGLALILTTIFDALFMGDIVKTRTLNDSVITISIMLLLIYIVHITIDFIFDCIDMHMHKKKEEEKKKSKIDFLRG